MIIMESAELVDKIVGGDTSASDVSDYIKGLLYTKAGEKVDALKPEIAAGLFGDKPEVSEEEPETEEEPESQEEE